MPVWYKADVIEIIDETPYVKRFFLKVKSNEIFSFEPGQFITLDLPISDKRQKRWRSYSIANIKNDDNILELCIVLKYDGLGSNYLFKEINKGSEITFKGPDGSFLLPKNLEAKNLIMICTGTGIAPFRAYLKAIFENNISYNELHLIFGARYESDILYRKEMEEYSNKYERFKYSIVLSRDANWKNKGYVHDIYMEDYKTIESNNIFYLCGWTAMVDQAVENLIIKMGYEKKQVVYELYG